MSGGPGAAPTGRVGYRLGEAVGSALWLKVFLPNRPPRVRLSECLPNKPCTVCIQVSVCFLQGTRCARGATAHRQENCSEGQSQVPRGVGVTPQPRRPFWRGRTWHLDLAVAVISQHVLPERTVPAGHRVTVIREQCPPPGRGPFLMVRKG